MRKVLHPSLLFVEQGQGIGTAWGCFAPGVACTAKHVVGESKEVYVVTVDGRRARAVVLNVHPKDDVAVLDVRALTPPPPPLPVSPVDGPTDGTVVCRAGPRPTPEAAPFLRCDPTAGTLLEWVASGPSGQDGPKRDGTTVARLLHLGVGIKGDSGGPIVDVITGLVLGIHVAEENGVGRGATAMAISDTFEPVREREAWVRACGLPAGPESIASRVLSLGCSATKDAARAIHYRELGKLFLALGRRTEAFSAFTEALTLDPRDAHAWLLRGLVFADHDAGHDDAAFAFRLSPALREDAALATVAGGIAPWAGRWATRLRDRSAPIGHRLATLIAPRGCASCPAFCAAVRATPKMHLFAAEGANHPTAETWLRARAEGRALSADSRDTSDGGTYVSIDERVGRDCTLRP